MNEQLTAINKKIQRTREELHRLESHGENPTPENKLTYEILLNRLSDLTLQKNLLDEVHSFPAVPSDPAKMLLNLTLETRKGMLSLRALSYFLYGSQHLVDLLSIFESADTHEHHGELLVRVVKSAPFTAEIRMDPSKSLQARTIENLIELFTFTDIAHIPPFLLDWDSNTFAYVQKWLAFLLEHELTVKGRISANSSESAEVEANPTSLKLTLQALKQIRKNDTEVFVISGFLNEINMEEKSIELIELNNQKRIRGKSTYGLLMKSRHYLGDNVTVKGTIILTENLATGEVKSAPIMNQLME
jgi:hypothetical protein